MGKYICDRCGNIFTASKKRKCEFCNSIAFVDTYGNYQKFKKEVMGGKYKLKLMAKQDNRIRKVLSKALKKK